MDAKTLDLLKEARRRSPQVYVNCLDDGTVEVVWLRPYTAYLSTVLSAVTSSAFDGLQRLLAIEDELLLRRLHGEGCDCEDCCIARIDRDRAKKT